MNGLVSEQLFQRATATATTVGSLTDAEDCAEAARLVKNGFAVAAFVRSVCVVLVDGENPDARQIINHIKGEKRAGKPFSTCLDAPAFVAMLDAHHLHPRLQPIFLNTEELAARLGDLCLIRVPLREDAGTKLPSAMTSITSDGTFWLQNWVPFQREGVSTMLQAMKQEGVRLPAVTSLNVSGEPELVTEEAGIAFCERHDIPLFLTESHTQTIVQGSFPIIGVHQAGVSLLREGHFPGFLFHYLLNGVVVNTSRARPSQYPRLQTHCAASARRTSAYQLRLEIIACLEGTPYKIPLPKGE